MAGVLVDAGFLIALLSRRDRHHSWAAAQLPRLALPWQTCEAALSEAFHLLGAGAMSLADACLVRMTETVADPVIFTTDADFRVYRRHGRQVIPCRTPY